MCVAGAVPASFAQLIGELAREHKVQPRCLEDATVDAAAAIALLRNVAKLWEAAASDEARSELLHAIYERIVVTRDRVVEVHLTPHAFRHGVALALPESVVVNKRRRQEPVTGMQSIVRIPIAGRQEWVAAARKSA